MVKEEHLAQLRAAMSTTEPISDSCWHDFTRYLSYRKLEVGEHFSRELNLTKELAFIVSGLIRIYSIDEEGVEWNKSLLRENEFMMASINPTLPSPVSIQAIFQTQTITIAFNEFMKLSVIHSELKKVIQQLASSYLEKEKTRNHLLMIKKSSERLEHFKTEFQDIYSQIPPPHIASYIGIEESEFTN